MAAEDPGNPEDRGISGEITRSQLRASHEDRDRVVEQLRVSAGDGRLTAEELDQRLELALSARTYGELARLVADLPTAGAAATRDAAALTVKPKDLIRIDCHSGNAQRNGPWIVPQRIEVRVSSGTVVLDLTEAVFTQPVLRINADVHSGNLKLIIKPGVVVDADEVAVHGGNMKVKTPWSHDVPELLRVEVSGKVHSGNIVAQPPRRTFWQWLARQPRPYEIAAPR
ncbi:MAG: DUF1707 domain-containing protein [Streptosporangiaceae bacterium]|nr:DUF1707 domain-containing protein [Streptosporangiaceae bacterium]